MPTLDEPALRDLLHRATGDLHAPPVAARIRTTGPRSHAPGVLVALGAGGAVAAAAVGLVVTGPGSAHVTPARTAARAAHAGATPAQRLLYELASVSERTPRDPASSVPAGADGGGAARSPFTAAQLATLPARPIPLRAALIAEADRGKAAAAEEATEARTDGDTTAVVRKMSALSREIAAESPSEEVFIQAAGILFDARTSPPVRAAAYEVLATTPGVTVADVAATPVKGSPGQTSTAPPLVSGISRSDVEIQALTGNGRFAFIVVNRRTGAVITLLQEPLTGAPRHGGPLQPLALTGPGRN